ncbi:MAG: macrolide ABC transporter ATP-binding protein [Flavobacteriaceae bacterium]|nr:macrolide ABC transporter ATP-binding protein [Flavobacteriaceae bacterium]|tara:strand:- start:1249 stop:1935 length:687 start_codon:yes stop_codon:yes gene_type:complete
MNVIETKNISKLYKQADLEIRALDNVSVNFKQGEFTAIVGPSGSGKTTFLNSIGGLDSPTKGQVLIDNNDITQLNSNKLIDFRLKNIGFVFQSYNLIPVLTAKENVEFIMLMQGVSNKIRDKRSKELLEAVGLQEHLNRRPNQLSGGQQQRVAVARALASKPKFVLADEPTANLDSSSTSNLLDIMYRLNNDEKMTFIFSTHDQRVIDRAKRIITLEDGKIISDTNIK